ncbi:hypothetical protein BC834DRAFT_845850 [Gloeopeniophorella convolvens]|nr:hypothetical protein BC834DRAFT_845850 [Gloeopeniophorella convolvens]
MTAIIDRIEQATDRIRDDEFLADKKRFESFKLGGGAPAAPSSQSRRHAHSRSHSRNVSLSISPSLSFSTSPSTVSLSTSASAHDLSPSVSANPVASSAAGAPAPKRNSHHRRRSSVSTRRESAEVMGVALPSLPPSNSDDNINLGDKDSVRRRALWALEGKPNSDAFAPVEIPELNTPEIERRISELPSKPSYPPPMGGFTSSLSGLVGLTNKRDSFSARVASSSIKDQLHTLVEEEEEEEEAETPVTPSSASHEFSTKTPSLPSSVLVSPSPASTRPRPAGLTLRPLSLTPDNLISAVNGELPTPSPTPTPSKPFGLKSLTLTTSPSLVSSPPSSDNVLSNAAAMRRRSVIVPPTHAPSSAAFFRRPSLTDSVSSTSSDVFEVPRKRSSISYKPSSHGLPTPELTPTTERRASAGSESDWDRPPSLTNEQHFLYQSQAALVTRIAELERTLSFRTHGQPPSRPVSFVASDTSSGGTEPTDETFRLVVDLKAERDELKRDIDGWRKRVADLETQTGTLARRVDAERREAWIARERLGLLEIEKRAATRAAEENDVAVLNLQAQLTAVQADFRVAREEVERGKDVARELERVRAELAEERRRRAELERALDEASLLNTPTPAADATSVHAHRMMSIDSLSSATDVESLDGFVPAGAELKSVLEEDEEVYSDQDNGLHGYDDEEDGDASFGSHDGSSVSSFDDLPPRSTAHLLPVSPSPSPSPSPARVSSPTHERAASLSRAWSFPARSVDASPQRVPEEIDRFFGCLEDMGDSPPTSAVTQDSTSANPFTRGFFGAANDDDDDDVLPPFVIPADVGVEVPPEPQVEEAPKEQGLSIVLEEEEPEDEEHVLPSADGEFVGERDEGGIKFTFAVPPFSVRSRSPSPSPELAKTPRKPVPYIEPAAEEDDLAFTFPRPRTPSSPSAIPRATALKRFESPTKSRLPLRTSPSSSPTTPPRKGVAARPSLIPQPASATRLPAPTFIPQPVALAKRPATAAPVPSIHTTTPLAAAPPVSSNPFAALQSLASLVPLSWTGARAEDPVSKLAPAVPSTSSAPRGFVSKERQLARLRERMAEERTQTNGQAQAPCRRCADGVVTP